MLWNIPDLIWTILLTFVLPEKIPTKKRKVFQIFRDWNKKITEYFPDSNESV